MAIRFLSLVFLICAATAAFAGQDRSGILLLAHGGSSEWNERVTTVAGVADRTQPTEVAFGMASRASIQAAIDRADGTWRD